LASRLKDGARTAKVDKIEQKIDVFMQRLDSKDKIAVRLQPVGGKHSHRQPASLRRSTRQTFTRMRTPLILVFKGLAIMNFS
jgi:hypothetical protein